MRETTVLIADDHAVVREGLQKLLEAEPGLRVVGLAENGRQAVEEARRLHPDVVLMDLRMPVLDGFLATRYIRESCPGTAVVVLTMYEQEEYVLNLLREGATGYRLKGVSSRGLIRAIRAAARGEPAFAPAEVARRAGTGAAGKAGGVVGNGAAAMLSFLSPRELDVLRLLGSGLSNREIGKTLYISERTVKKHVSRILTKLRVRSRTEAVVTAARRGLISVSR